MQHRLIHSNHYPRSFLWSLGLLTSAIIFKLFNQLNADYDLWWHIFIGKEIISKGMLERLDIYSFTAFGQPYINHEWVSEIIMAGSYSLGAIPGLILWRWSMALIILLFAWRLIKLTTQHNVSRIIMLLCFGLVLSPGISFRVHLFSYSMLIILLNLIYLARDKNRLPSIFSVCVLFVLWANLHGAFVLGLLMWSIYVMAYMHQQKRYSRLPKAFIYILLPISATLINPFGPKLWIFIYRELTNPLNKEYITEWQAFGFAAREMPFFIVLSLTWAAFFFSKRKKEIDETVILLFASILGLISVRHTPLFVILALPSMACHMDGFFLRLLQLTREEKHLSRRSIYIPTLFILCFSAFFFVLGIPNRWEIQYGQNPIPAQTVTFLKENNIRGNLWVPLHFGGYALFHLYPDIKVSIDGRWSMVYQHQVMKDNMIFAFHGTNGKWKQLLEKYKANFALVEPGNPAIKEMNKDLDWIWIFRGNAANLLINREYLASLGFSIIPSKL